MQLQSFLPTARHGLVTAAALLASVPCWAQPAAGPYVGFGLGANDLRTQTISRVETPFGNVPPGDIRAKSGSILNLSVGWGFDNGLRLELEANRRSNEFRQATAGGLVQAAASGKQKQDGTFFNVLYDFNAYRGVAPYVGLGLGSVSTKWDNVVSFDADERVRLNAKDTVKAYQLILGATFLRDFQPGWSLNLEYRYMASNDDRRYPGRIEESMFGAFPVAVTLPELRNHAVQLGLRYRFGR